MLQITDFSCFQPPDVVFIMSMNVKMPTDVKISTCKMSTLFWHFNILTCVWHFNIHRHDQSYAKLD